MTFIYILCGALALLCFALVFLLMSSKRNEADAVARMETTDLALQNASELRAEEQAKFAEEVRFKNDTVTRLSTELAREQTKTENLAQQAKRDKEELEKLQASFRIEFKNLANEILEEKSTQFKKTNKESLDILLNPFKESMEGFRKRVETLHTEDTKNRGELGKQLEMLHELNRKITEETTNLTNALRGDSRIQGDWGEAILETILDSSNLVHGIHYKTQVNIKDAEGKNLRPDVVLKLPDSKNIVIDSKVSLTAYVNYTSEKVAEKRKKHLESHLRSVRTHVNDLGRKSYQEDVLDSPDFVIMFVPNEPAFMTALQNDETIWSDAYNKKVIISSPTNLFALLKIVDDLWQRDAQGKNAIEIAERGGELYDKFVGFLETLQSVDRSLQSTSNHFDRAMRQLDGHWSLIRQVENLRELGVRAKKTLPQEFADVTLENEDRVEGRDKQLEQEQEDED